MGNCLQFMSLFVAHIFFFPDGETLLFAPLLLLLTSPFFSQPQPQMKEQKKIIGSVFLAKSAYNSQNTQIDLVMENKKNKTKTHPSTKFLPIFNGRNNPSLYLKAIVDDRNYLTYFYGFTHCCSYQRNTLTPFIALSTTKDGKF